MSILKTISIFLVGGVIVSGVLFFENKNKNNLYKNNIQQTNNFSKVEQNKVEQNSISNNASSGLETNRTNVNTSLEDLLAQASYAPTMCKGTTTNSQGAVINTTVYLYQKMVRGDSVVSFRGTTNKGSVIVRDGFIYAWQGNQGTKVALSGSISPSIINSFGSGTGLTNNPYACEPWTPNLGVFSVPTSVSFPDIGVMKINPSMVNNPQFTEQDLDRMMQESGFDFQQ